MAKLIYRAVTDDKTCSVCAERDGQAVKLSDISTNVCLNGNMGCRCTMETDDLVDSGEIGDSGDTRLMQLGLMDWETKDE